MDGSNPVGTLRLDPLARDAVAVLVHVLMRFDRAADAAVLLAALIELDPASPWARRAACAAMLQAGWPNQALAEAQSLLDGVPLGRDAAPLLHVAAKACWRLGREDEARQYWRSARKALDFSTAGAGAYRPYRS